MQAVVLVGGRGERLRPLTLTTPKPLVPLANRPLVEHIVRWLTDMGVSEILLLTQYRAASFGAWLATWRGVPVRTIEEPVPLGTAGAVANVGHLLRGTIAVVNGDNITNLDLRAMLNAHQAAGALVSIAVDDVDDPTGRGVVVADDHGRVSRFQEKPPRGSALAKTVNTGTYLIEPEALRGLPPGRMAMWETDLFPALIARGASVYAFSHPHLWLDAGTPAGYFAAQAAILGGQASSPAGEYTGRLWQEPGVHIHPSVQCDGEVALGAGTQLAAHVRLIGPSTIGRRCRVEEAASITSSAVWDGTTVGSGARIDASIIGYNCLVGPGATLSGAVLADGTHVPHGARIGSGA